MVDRRGIRYKLSNENNLDDIYDPALEASANQSISHTQSKQNSFHEFIDAQTLSMIK